MGFVSLKLLARPVFRMSSLLGLAGLRHLISSGWLPQYLEVLNEVPTSTARPCAGEVSVPLLSRSPPVTVGGSPARGARWGRAGSAGPVCGLPGRGPASVVGCGCLCRWEYPLLGWLARCWICSVPFKVWGSSSARCWWFPAAPAVCHSVNTFS